MKFQSLATVVLVLALGCSGTTPKPIEFSQQPYFFDLGDSDSELESGYIPVTPDFYYSPENGYGLMSRNQQGFYHEETIDARDVSLIDGVIGEKIGFKADVPSGAWQITIWMEFGMEDSSTTRLSANGENITPALQPFSQEAEPRTVIDKTYRVMQREVEVGDKGLSIELKGGEDDVRLLSIALIPTPAAPSGEAQEKMYAQIEHTGTFDSEVDLGSLITELDKLAQDPANQNFATYYKLQAEILQEGEKYFYYRGWSHRTDETGLGLFDHIHQGIQSYDGFLTGSKAKENPLYDRALWYNARLLYWLWLEGAGPREEVAAKRKMAEMLERHPDDKIVQMYNGIKIDEEDPFDDAVKPANAPDWAWAEWEMMNRLKHITDWWVLEQQSENGEFGGKFGDDVEILRFWSPLILSGDTVAYNGWKKLADGVYNSSKVHLGYAKKPSDVEHSSEFISDTAPLMVLYNDEAEYADRLAYSSEYFRNLWTGFNDAGHRFFKSAWFSSTEIETEPPKNRDVSYNARATKAVRYHAWKTGDPETIQALKEWGDAWLAVSQQTSKGKPVGVIPPSVEFPTQKINGDEPTWYDANMYWDYFNWSGSHAILDQLLFTWYLTNDEKYLLPITQNLELVAKHERILSRNKRDFEEGSEEWAAWVMGNSSEFWNVTGTWRLLTGNTSYDDLIRAKGTPFIKYRLTGEEHYLVEGIGEYLETIRYNYPMVTYEVIHTDRVHIKEGNVREASILQGMVTGFGIAESASPYIAVSWEKASRDLTFLVTDSDDTSLSIDLYSFSDIDEEVTMRLWQLQNGLYSITTFIDGEEHDIRAIDVEERGDRNMISIPPGIPVTIQLKKLGN